mmetsp:Transcript_18694/g.56459  ORF Transcript_18694/g.56459 Transcript_18694/m.56459 type:complete len:137 (-) Transcript_18694:220-630(-)
MQCLYQALLCNLVGFLLFSAVTVLAPSVTTVIPTTTIEVAILIDLRSSPLLLLRVVDLRHSLPRRRRPDFSHPSQRRTRPVMGILGLLYVGRSNIPAPAPSWDSVAVNSPMPIRHLQALSEHQRRCGPMKINTSAS